MREMVIATRNCGKAAEIADALAALPVRFLTLDEFAGVGEVEENGDSLAANAVLKATRYALATGKACLADDSGLEVDALGGAPGVRSARYAGPGASDAACNAKLLAALAAVPADERTARFRCVLAYVDRSGTLFTAEGVCEGVILGEPRGTGGFGYDPLFFVPSLGKTMAELAPTEKNAVSHRGHALRNMAAILAEHFRENRRS
mgnify:CR=1 FL=1